MHCLLKENAYLCTVNLKIVHIWILQNKNILMS